MKVVSTLLTGGLVVGGLVAVTVPSQAALTTRCVGTAGAVTVPGDLVVPADRSCSLEGTIIQGNVRVQTGADLLITSGTIEGNLVAQEDAYIDAEGTTVGGNVVSRGSWGVFMTEGAVAGNYNSPVNAPRGGFLLGDRTAFDGNVVDRAGTTMLVSSTVAGNVTGNGNVASDLEDSVIEGNLTIRDTEEGSLLCDSEVYGNADYRNNADAIQIGGAVPWGTCGGSAYFDGNVSINNTTGGVFINGAIIRGDLSGTRNAPAPISSDNRVRGEVSGQFADDAAAALSRSRVSATPAGEDRVSGAREAAETRSKAAQAEAVEAGAARL